MRPNATRKEIADGCATFDEYVRFVTPLRAYNGPEILKFAKSYRDTCNSSASTTASALSTSTITTKGLKPWLKRRQQQRGNAQPGCTCLTPFDPRGAHHWFVYF